jgi:hypothetical protein
VPSLVLRCDRKLGLARVMNEEVGCSLYACLPRSYRKITKAALRSSGSTQRSHAFFCDRSTSDVVAKSCGESVGDGGDLVQEQAS